MPPLSRVRHEALRAVVAQLRYAGREALLRDVDRAEALAAEIDESLEYPVEWIVFRLTGYRPEGGEAALVSGAALLADLSALVEHLCHAAGLREEEAGPEACTLEELAERWSVSVKTLGRWRRRGLIARRVVGEGGAVRLVVSGGVARTWASRHADRLGRAGAFSRIDEATGAAMVRRARRYHDLLGLPATRCAERLAARYGRSREAVRRLLARHDQAARARPGGEPIFDAPEALPPGKRRAVERAWRRGIEPGVLAARYGRSRAGIHRIVAEQRLARLRRLDIGRIAPHAAGLDAGGVEAVLADPALSEVPPAPRPEDMIGLVELMRRRVPPVVARERAWSRAEHALRARALDAIARAGGGFPEVRLIDRAETDLRRADALRAALAMTHLALVLETLEGRLGAPIDQARGEDARRVVEAGLGALSRGLDAFDPWKSGRLAAPVGLAAAKIRPPESPEARGVGRARVRMRPGTPAPDWTLIASPWATGLRPDPRIAEALSRLPEEQAGLLAERFGLGGRVAHTLAEVASARGLTEMQAGRLERLAIRAALGRGDGG